MDTTSYSSSPTQSLYSDDSGQDLEITSEDFPRHEPNMLRFGGPRKIPPDRCVLCRQEAFENDETGKIRTGFPLKVTAHYHRLCYEILGSSYPTTERRRILEYIYQFNSATKPLYEPSDREKRDRASILEGLFSSSLIAHILKDSFKLELLRGFPGEILDMILDFIGPCSYLIVLGESRRLIDEMLRRPNPASERVDLSKDIFISRIKYQGISYISRVSNISCKEAWEMDAAEEVITSPHDTIDRLVVSTDHMGVHKYQLLQQGSNISPGGSPWYQSIEMSKAVLNNGLLCRRGHLFLRVVKVNSESDGDSTTASDRDNVRYWTTPFPPDVKPWNLNSSGQNEISRLHYTPISSDAQGLVVCCSYAMNIGVHAFTGVSKDYKDFVRKMTAKPHYEVFWMYFPLHAGEYIRYCWIRQFKGYSGVGGGGHSNKPVIVLETTRDRTITFGPYTNVNIRKHLHFYSFVKDGDGFVSGIIHDGEDPKSAYVGEMGVTTAHPPSATSPPKIIPESSRITPISNPNEKNHPSILNFIKAYRRGGPKMEIYNPPPTPPDDTPDIWWYMTKAPLENLVSVQTCRDTTLEHKPYIGLLLTYTDGSRECLGQFRWDVEVSDYMELPLRMQIEGLSFDEEDRYPLCSIEEGFDYISEVCGKGMKAQSTEFEEYEEWIETPDKGTMIWWFGVLGFWGTRLCLRISTGEGHRSYVTIEGIWEMWKRYCFGS